MPRGDTITDGQKHFPRGDTLTNGRTDNVKSCLEATH